MSNEIIQLEEGGVLYAIVIPAGYTKPGVTFLTPNSFSQQLAFIAHPAGHSIPAHVHKPVPRQVEFTRETLIMRRGRMRVDFYREDEVYLFSYVLEAGDVVLLVNGGHGFEILEEVEMVEVKQGPYPGMEDKRRFASVSPERVTLRSV